MKRIVALFLFLIVFLLCGRCSEQSSSTNSVSVSDYDIDMNLGSVYDTETKTVLSVGESQQKFDEVLGESEYGAFWERHNYEGGISVQFNVTDGNARDILIDLTKAGNRFIFPNFDTGMDRSDMEEKYDVIDDTVLEDVVIYQQSYDENYACVDMEDETNVLTVGIMQDKDSGEWESYGVNGHMSDEEIEALIDAAKSTT